MQAGKFITFEGPDGSGKTSVIKAIVTQLQTQGIDPVVTREPGGYGSDIAEQIRELILDVNNTAMDARTEALLYAAGRRQHLVDTVIPALENNDLVISDRFVDSSLAYQGVARGLTMERIWELNQFAIDGQLPDFTILIDVPAEVGLERIYQARGKRQFDRLDQESIEFHEMVRQAFLDLAAYFPSRIHKIDGSGTVEEVAEACMLLLKEHQVINI